MQEKTTRYERQVPWEPLPCSPLREAVWQFLATASLCFGAWYIGWRWLASLNPDALWFSVPLALAETMAFLGLVIFTINLWTARSPEPGPLPMTAADIGAEHGDDRPLAVDVFFATYNEDPELVRLGLRSAKALRYPHPITLRVHALDDGRRPAMAAVATEEGVHYVTRGDNLGYKAGNLSNAMAVTSGDLIVICDADTQLLPTFLEETLGYFRDPKMAWVQTPQWFYDVPPGVPLPAALGRRLGSAGSRMGRMVERMIGPVRLGEDPFANDPQLFFDVILRRRNAANASFCCGAGSVHRREAVMEAALRQWAERVEATSLANVAAARRLTGEAMLDVGIAERITWQGAVEEELTPYKFHVSEDIYTSIVLHSDRERGWKSVLHPKVQTKMLSPNDLLAWTIQRFKYAGGTLDILFNDNPLFRRGLTFAQKVMYGATFYSYLSPVWNAVFVTAPIVFLFTGIPPLAGYTLDFFLHITPFLVLKELAQMVGVWGISNMKGRAWYLATFPLNFRALVTVLRGEPIVFGVTPKQRAEGRHLRLVRVQIAIVVLTLLGLAAGWGSLSMGREGYGLGAMIANTLWGLMNVFSLLPIIRAAVWQPDAEFETAIVEGRA